MDAKINDLFGKILSDIKVNGNDEIIFTLKDGTNYRMYHEQSCCEHVRIEDIAGNLEDLIGNPITMSEISTNSDEKIDGHLSNLDSFTWTFYKFATVKGYVNIRWLGTSNGYYSERVDFEKIFTPVNISKADQMLVAKYGYYCEGMVNIAEMPLTFDDWQEDNQ